MTRTLESARPEDVGLSSDGLDRIDAAIQDYIDRGTIAGAVTLVARQGRLVHTKAMGMKDVASAERVRPDTIFRIFSMTKPITAVAMMILHDEGLWRPEDPISKHLPELDGMKVVAEFNAEGQPLLEAAETSPTMLQLMTHTAGFAYGMLGMTPIDKLYNDAGLWKTRSLNEMIDVLSGLPLAYQPGSKWRYSLSMDVQGAIIERLAGQPLAKFLRERIFEPLGMVDTGFFTPPSKKARLATLYFGGDQGLIPTEHPMGKDYDVEPPAPRAGGGLVSTALDYARFAQLLLNKGEFAGRRIVSEAGIATMMTNHMSDDMLAAGYVAGHHKFRPGFGYGYNGVVFTDPAVAGVPVGRGTYHWDGAAGTWFWVDPENDLLFVGMIQLLSWTAPAFQSLTQTMMADAIVDPAAA